MSVADRSEPTISIVTACYNSTPFLERIHRSLVEQTYSNFEWICVDDCSTDDTVEHLIKLEAPGELGMQVYRLPQNTGGPVALAVGTERSRGDIVVWLDHDDELFPFALEQIRANWPLVDKRSGLSGLFFRASDPADGSLIGQELPSGQPFTWSELTNRHPDVCDGTLALKGDVILRYVNIESMEGVILNGVIYNELTADRPFLIADAPSIRFYHRDNRHSQTRFERISRKSVASYARIIDGADRHYLRNPGRWARHIATLLRYSKEVNGSWFEGLRPIRRRSIRLVARALWPLGLLAYRHRRSSNIVDLPFFRRELADGLENLWRRPK